MPLQATSGAASYDAFGGGVAAVPNYIEDVFSTYLYTGNGSTQTINNGIDLSTKGGLVWAKPRSSATSHCLIDTARGTGKIIYSDATAAQATDANALTAFNTTGYSMGGSGQTNSSGVTYASWTFRKQPKFFDVVTWTGNGAASQQISHSLGSVPGSIAAKRTSSSWYWINYHRSLGNTQAVFFNQTTAAITASAWWNNTDPTSSVFTVGSELNAAGETFVAYVFAHNAGGFGLTGTDNVISCGSFTGASEAASVTLGWEPQWIMVKRTDSTGNWFMFDNMRGMFAPTQLGAGLFANLSNAEISPYGNVPFVTSTGFFWNGVNNFVAAGSPSYIYIAIRRGPMRTPTSGTSVYNGVARSGTGANNLVVNTGNLPDMVWPEYRNTAATRDMYDRLRGFGQTLVSSSTGAEVNNYPTYGPQAMGNASYTQGTNDGANYNASGYTFIDWVFTRAPGFFDEVCYTGTGSATTFSHNLTVVPELMIVKRRDASSGSWQTYTAATGNSAFLQLSSTSAVITGSSNRWNSTTPTASVFSIGNDASVNASGGTYVNYMFATCPGVSKVGSYTGTGAAQTIDCGFTSGARFVLIKRTDDVGDWYVWDSARGIVAGNDPYLLLNSTAAEVTSTDYVDTYSAGFEISSTAPAAINASGGSFIFLAIA